MGTTIRREPVTTSIPAAPDYRFLNITNFGGIEKSSNPFVVESNTASDCLNVYVDEDNALSTRPRLQHQTDFIKDIIDKFPALGLTGAFDLIGVYDLHDGYLIHGVESDIYYMFKYIDKNSIYQITGNEIPIEKCKVFEQSDVIYVLDGQKYRNIKNFVISEVEGYVPLVTVGKNKKTVTINPDNTESVTIDHGGAPLESPNILSDKGRESYFWDGSWNIGELGENYKMLPAFERTTVWSVPATFIPDSREAVFKFIPEYASSDFINDRYVLMRKQKSDENRDVIGIGTLNGNFKELTQFKPLPEPAVLPRMKITATADCNDDASQIVIRYESSEQNIGDISYGGLFVYDAIENSWTDLNNGDIEHMFISNTSHHKHVVISQDGGVVVTYSRVSVGSRDTFLLVYKYDSNTKKYNRYVIDLQAKSVGGDDLYEFEIVGVEMSKDGTTLACLIRNGDYSREGDIADELYKENYNDLLYFNQILYVRTENVKTDEIVNLVTKDKVPNGYLSIYTPHFTGYPAYKDYGFYNIALSQDGMQLYATFAGDAAPVLYQNLFDVFYDDTTYRDPEHIELPVTTKINNEVFIENYVFAPYFTKNKLFVIYGQSNSAKTGYFILDETLRFVPNNIDLPEFNPGKTAQFATDDSYFLLNWKSKHTRECEFYYTKLNFDSEEPIVEVVRLLKDINIEFPNELSTTLNASKLCQRFDNNTWFASNNYTFRTLYNDPTYIPLSGYNDLGEDYEPITGLSIVNDNILAAYKRNRIYIITPITVGNELTYSYTETKNIIGNDVVDAPTLTILTEMPILVSYNGIYALNQLENVQSSDRITTLISEAMNPKWLKESQTDIDGCLVLNRLYWTYFVLPHKKSTNGLIKDNNHTKVYLLDNRTGSWFYWELPIYVISAMVKNNKMHFVTEDGELFTLETTDIINKFNKDLTEYYDDLKKPTLIPWNWTSQILSLNTINYSKRLVDTTFVLTDTDMSDEYALNYKFKAFRKNKNAETTELTLTNDIEYVESITKRTMIPRFNFLQFTLSNTEDDEKLNNNKLRLVGLGLKYVLLGGLY